MSKEVSTSVEVKMRHPQSDLLMIAALYVFSEATEDIIGEHAWNLAVELAEEHGLTVQDAIYNLEYVRPKAL